MRRRGLIACLVLALAVSGCVGLLDSGGDVDPATVDREVQNRLDGIETLRATVVWNRTGDYAETARLRIAYARPDRVRMVFENGSLAGTRIVSNGSATWRYDPDEGAVRVTRGPYLDGLGDLLPGVEGLDANATFEGNETLAGEDAVELSYAVQGSEVSLLLAGGEQTSEFSQSAGASRARFRVWFDTDRWFPRKSRVTMPMYRDNRTVTMHYRSVEIDPDLPAGTFTFDPPADARVDQGDRSAFRPPDNATAHDSLSAAREDAPVSVSEPTVPERFGFTVARTFSAPNMTGLELTYEDGRDRIEVVVIRERPRFFDGGKSIEIGGREGLLVEHPQGRIVQWECDGTLRLVAGPADLDTERLVAVARSVGCPG